MIDKSKFYINGKWVNPSKKNDFNVINPSDEKPFAYISLGSEIDINNAVKAAKEAFISWSQVDKKTKIHILEKLLQIYQSRWNEISETMSKEMGAPLEWSSSAQTSSGYDHINDFIKRLKEFKLSKSLMMNLIITSYMSL